MTDGAQFYPAMRNAILRAQASVNLEAYIRSFEHNDEVNVAFLAAVNARLLGDFESDLAASDEMTCDGWYKGRPWLEKLVGPACWILERQQQTNIFRFCI